MDLSIFTDLLELLQGLGAENVFPALVIFTLVGLAKALKVLPDDGSWVRLAVLGLSFLSLDGALDESTLTTGADLFVTSGIAALFHKLYQGFVQQYADKALSAIQGAISSGE